MTPEMKFQPTMKVILFTLLFINFHFEGGSRVEWEMQVDENSYRSNFLFDSLKF